MNLRSKIVICWILLICAFAGSLLYPIGFLFSAFLMLSRIIIPMISRKILVFLLILIVGSVLLPLLAYSFDQSDQPPWLGTMVLAVGIACDLMVVITIAISDVYTFRRKTRTA